MCNKCEKSKKPSLKQYLRNLFPTSNGPIWSCKYCNAKFIESKTTLKIKKRFLYSFPLVYSAVLLVTSLALKLISILISILSVFISFIFYFIVILIIYHYTKFEEKIEIYSKEKGSAEKKE